MRLLVVTQAVDTDELLLGFFHRWIERLAGRCERIHIVCLKEGPHTLPPHVHVHSLGKETGRSRFKYVFRFYFHIWKYRKEYDAVFVHMNQEYVLLAGLLWRIMGKRVVLWRNHKRGSLWTRIAGIFAHTVCFTSPEAYVADFANAVKMPLGIDTDMFKPTELPNMGTVLLLGRLDPVKRADVFVEALAQIGKSSKFRADIYGEPSEGNESYAARVRAQAQPLVAGGMLAFRGGIRHAQTPAVYTAHSIYVNVTPSGSFDKTIGEAMASGCVVATANDAVREVVPPELFVADSSAEAVARAIRAALALDSGGRTRVSARLREHILAEHSLNRLMERLVMMYTV